MTDIEDRFPINILARKEYTDYVAYFTYLYFLLGQVLDQKQCNVST